MAYPHPCTPCTFTPNNNSAPPHHLFDDVLDLTSARTADHDLQYLTALRAANPDTVVTAIPANNIPLLAFAGAGFATYELDKETDSFASWRGYVGPSANSREGQLAESVQFAKYHYQWSNEDFILYVVSGVQYVLKERRGSEHPLGPSNATDALIKAVGGWLLNNVVWVFDGYWYQDKKLFQEVHKMTWDKVILDEGMKKELQEAAEKFFDSKDAYEDIGVPWKRGVMFHGPPGNGKTISIKALMHSLLDRKPSIPTLYVKTAPSEYHIKSVFSQARALAPCMLVLEDIETIVTPYTRSYFFNQMDGLEDNSGLFVVASTNYLEKLDPGLTSRPSRFDRKYLFPLPNQHERTLYCEYWRRKVAHEGDIKFPEKLCPAMASVTEQFSFAFLQECFVASLLAIVHQTDAAEQKGDKDDLEKYELWVVFKKQADILRKEIRTESAPENESANGPSRMAIAPPPMPASRNMLGQNQMPSKGEMNVGSAFQQLAVRDGQAAALPNHKNARINPAAFEWY